MRRTLPVLLLAATLTGCSSKSNSNAITADTEKVDTNATYTLRFQEAAKGDAYDVLKVRDATAAVTMLNQKTTTTLKDQFRFEFTETILDTAPDEPRPTKVSRVYKKAEKANQQGSMEQRSYVGKTVTIEKFMKGYKFTVGANQSLPVPEQLEVNQDFTASNWRIEQNFPNKPVKVGDTWNVDFAAITALGGNPQLKYDKEKSTFTGKLTKVAQKDGRLWGTVEMKIVLVVNATAPNGSPITGEVKTDTTLEIVIDGSARAGTMKMQLASSINDRDPVGNERKTVITGTEERSITPLK